MHLFTSAQTRSRCLAAAETVTTLRRSNCAHELYVHPLASAQIKVPTGLEAQTATTPPSVVYVKLAMQKWPHKFPVRPALATQMMAPFRGSAQIHYPRVGAQIPPDLGVVFRGSHTVRSLAGETTTRCNCAHDHTNHLQLHIHVCTSNRGNT